MTDQTPHDPQAEKAAVDPFVDLAKHYVATIDEFEGQKGTPDEEIEAHDINVRTPLERQLAKLRPTSCEGIVAALDLVLREEREEHGGGEPYWSGEYIIALLENARSAVDAGVGVVTGPGDPLPALLAEWEAAFATAEKVGEEAPDSDMGDEQVAEINERTLIPLQNKIIDTPPHTFAGVVAKLRMMVHFDKELGCVVPDNLVATALAGAEHIMRGPGVAAAGPDSLVALWSEWDGLRKNATAPADVTDEEAREAFTAGVVSQMEAIEERIMAAVPSTLAGALVQMSVLSELGTTEIAPPKKDIDAALAGIVAGRGGAS